MQLGRTPRAGSAPAAIPKSATPRRKKSVEEIRRGPRRGEDRHSVRGSRRRHRLRRRAHRRRVAREQNALVVAVATLPFAFEGSAAGAQAEEALGALQRNSDLVIIFENDRMSDTVSPLPASRKRFVADQTISQSVRALAGLTRQRGLVHIGFDELATVLSAERRRAAPCLFGYGEADGDNRAHEALARALKSPLMDKGRMLEDARNVLVSVAGGPSMTLNEVQILMENSTATSATRRLSSGRQWIRSWDRDHRNHRERDPRRSGSGRLCPGRRRPRRGSPCAPRRR